MARWREASDMARYIAQFCSLGDADGFLEDSVMSYSTEQRREALRVFKRTQSVTKTIRELGFPGRRTMHRWVREGVSPGRRRRKGKAAASYPVEVKL